MMNKYLLIILQNLIVINLILFVDWRWGVFSLILTELIFGLYTKNKKILKGCYYGIVMTIFSWNLSFGFLCAVYYWLIIDVIKEVYLHVKYKQKKLKLFS